MTSGRTAAVCALAMLPAVVCGAQRPGDFRVLGPGGGGATFRPTVSPVDPQTALLTSDMGGEYITHDGGKSWRMFNLRGMARGFAFDPSDAKVMYALGIGLWRSQDGGDTWQLLAPHADKVAGFSDPSDEADESLLAHDGSDRQQAYVTDPSAMVIDPLDGKKLYVAFGSHLWHSKDGGVHWQLDDDLPESVTHMALARKTPSSPAALWMAGPKGFWLSKGFMPQSFRLPEGGEELRDESIDVGDGKVTLLAVKGDTLFAAVVGADDHPTNLEWRALKPPGANAKIITAAGGHDGKTIYAGFSDMKVGGVISAGFAKTVDMGLSWTMALKDDGSGAPNFEDGWLSAFWHDPPLSVTVSERDHNLLYATDPGKTMKSEDGGGHWTALYSHKGADGGAVSSGIDVLTNYGVFFDPFDAKRMFVAYTDIGLQRSENGGESWWSSYNGCPWHNTTYWMVFDPAVQGRAWAAMSNIHDLPRPRVWRGREPESFEGGVCVTSDGGKTWSESSEGMVPSAATHIVMDPKSPVEKRTLYVAALGQGVYKSVDGGQSWKLKNDGIIGRHPLAWRLAQASDGTLYLVVARYADNLRPHDTRGDEGRVYRSSDGGEGWELLTLPPGVNGPNGITVDPRDPKHVYLAAWPRNEGRNGLNGGIYESHDAGVTWKLIFNYRQHIYDVTYNPANPDELFATGFESSAFRSMDGGVHWRRIVGYNFKAGHRIMADPQHPGMVYINTFGGGLWHGRVDAAAGTEDITTKEVAP